MKCLVIILLLLLSTRTVFMLYADCPGGQYPYGSCSSCFTIVNNSESFTDAAQFCRESGGALLSIRDEADFAQLARYLEGLSEDRTIWIGYKYNTTGDRITVDGEIAPEVIQNDQNFVGSTAGDEFTCVAVQGSSLVNVDCSKLQAFSCIYSYGVPSAVPTPRDRVVYVPASQMNFDLSVEVTSPSASDLTVEWRLNNVPIPTTGYIVTTRNGILTSQRVFSLTILTFDPSVHAGVYELVVTGSAGSAVSATWEVREAVLGSITVEPQNVTVLREQIAAFECVAGNALPRATVTWYKDSSPFNISKDDRYVSDVTGTLFIRNVSASDEGQYSCVCVNSAGSVRSGDASLTVSTTFQPEVAEFFIHPRPLTLMAGEPYSLECVGWQTFDTAITSYQFFFNQSFFFTEPDARYMYPADSGFPVYRIEAITVEEATDCASCTISPAVPMAFDEIQDSDKVPLIVHALTSVTELVTVVNGIETEDSLVPIPNGADVSIRCEYTGVPIPSTVEWTQDGRVVQVGVVTDEGVSTLSVTSAGSVYQCHVTNQYGRDTAFVYICSDEQEELPGAVTFTAEPNTDSSLYVTWNHPLTTHPLLLRYEVKVQPVDSGPSVSYFPPPGALTIAGGLLPGNLYRVSVVAMSSLGRGQESEAILTRTFGNPVTDTVTGVTAQQTSDNAAIVITWDAVATEMVAPLPNVYEVEYRVIGSDETVLELVNDNILVIQGLQNNADTYEVRVRIITQSQRDPIVFVPAPWSAWVEVAGVTTLPPMQPGTPTTRPLLSPMGLLLVYVCVPVGVVMLVGVCLCVTLVVWCCSRNNRKRVYHPSRQERRSVKNEQRPMGSQVYALPFNNHVANKSHVWVENTGYTAHTTPTPHTEVETPTPALSLRSGTVTITYLDDDETSSTSSPILEPTSRTEWNGASARPRTATPANRHDNTNVPTSAKGSTSFEHYYSEAKGAEDDMYRLAVALDMDLSRSDTNIHHHSNKPTTRSVSNIDIKNRRLSEEYDSLEPSPDLKGAGQVGGASHDTTDFDFQVLEELAAESAALASHSGTPDPYAPPPSNFNL